MSYKPSAIENSELRKTASSAGLIGLTAFGGAIFGFILQLLVAFYFGAGTSTDAYFMAQSTSEMLTKLLLGGSITAVFLPLFVERLTRGKRQDAWDLALNIFHLTTAAFIVVIVLLGVFAAPFVHFVAPGFDANTTALTVSLLRVLLPSFLFLYLVELATSMLHSLKVFSLPAILRIVAPAVSIITILLFVKALGIYALALGAVLGSILQLAILLTGLRRHGLSYRFIFQPLDPTIKKLLYLVYPFIFSVLMTQGAGIVYRILVSDLPAGSLASLKFAEKITQLITVIFLNSVTLVIYPLLSEKASQKNYRGIRETIGSAMRLITFISLPIIIAVALLRDPIVTVLYQRGSFNAEDAAQTSLALLFLVIGLTTNGIGSILGHATLALQQTRASVAVSIASQAIAIALFVLLVPYLGHAGLALGSSLVPLSIGLLYFLYLTRFIPNLKLIFWHSTYLKTLILSSLLALTIVVLQPTTYSLQPILRLLIPAIIGMSVYLAGAHIWKIPEMSDLAAIAGGKFKKWRLNSSFLVPRS